ncbi:MAG: hypothetical protein WD068_02275 [Candidatus Babeliales bacterium]
MKKQLLIMLAFGIIGSMQAMDEDTEAYKHYVSNSVPTTSANSIHNDDISLLLDLVGMTYSDYEDETIPEHPQKSAGLSNKQTNAQQPQLTAQKSLKLPNYSEADHLQQELVNSLGKITLTLNKNKPLENKDLEGIKTIIHWIKKHQTYDLIDEEIIGLTQELDSMHPECTQKCLLCDIITSILHCITAESQSPNKAPEPTLACLLEEIKIYVLNDQLLNTHDLYKNCQAILDTVYETKDFSSLSNEIVTLADTIYNNHTECYTAPEGCRVCQLTGRIKGLLKVAKKQTVLAEKSTEANLKKLIKVTT